MTDQLTETVTTSWFARIKSALTGIVSGAALVIATCVVLFWNEGRAVDTAAALEQGAGLVQTVLPGSVDAAMNGRLIHFSGPLAVDETLRDATFESASPPLGSVRLERSVDMLQWVQQTKSEKRKKLGGGEETVTTYTYDTQWKTSAVDSSRFKQPEGHANPPMAMDAAAGTVDHVSVGQIRIAGDRIASLGERNALPVTNEILAQVRLHFGPQKSVFPKDGAIWIVQDRRSPTVGDLRLRFTYNGVETISAVGAYESGTLERFKTDNGRSIFMVRSGTVDAGQMFEDAITGAGKMTWIIRVAAFLVMLAGFKMMFALAGVLGDVVPFIGDVFRFATGLAAFACTAILSTTIIGIAWIYYRPLVGAAILGVGLLFAVIALVLGKRKASASIAEDQQVEALT